MPFIHNRSILILGFIWAITNVCFASDDLTVARVLDPGIPVDMVKVHDPGFVVFERKSGEKIEARYEGIDWKTLDGWLDSAKADSNPRSMILNYNQEKGTFVQDIASKETFRLFAISGAHPIEIAKDRCNDQYSSTEGMIMCSRMVRGAWDAELNRAYQELGGSNNELLRDAQRKWIEFRDAEIDYLADELGSRTGTMWRIVLASYVTTLTEQQAKRLMSIAGNK